MRQEAKLYHSELTGEIIGAAVEVHRHLGPGLLESVYEECLCRELKLRGVVVERQKPLPLAYKGISLDCGYRLDLLVEGRIIVEIKAVDMLAPIHEPQLLTYIRLAKMKVGLLINFNVAALRNGIKRFVL
jgi:GxxExxY protein